MSSCGEAGEEAQRIGFAIPSSTVTCIADQLVEDGKVTSRGRAALVVVTVADGGPAVEAPSRPGDIVTAPDATPITAVQVLAEALAAHSPGDKHSLNSYRAGGPHTAQSALDTLGSPWVPAGVLVLRPDGTPRIPLWTAHRLRRELSLLARFERYLLQDFPVIHLIIGGFGNTTFLVGSVFFLFPSLERMALWLFVAGSLGMCVGTVGEVFVRHARRNRKSRA